MADYYTGSRLLEPLCHLIGHSVDGINFAVSCILAILMAQVMRRYLSPSQISPVQRMLIESILGCVLLWFCFGYTVVYLLIQSLVAYALMALLPNSIYMASAVTIWSMGFLSVCHSYRQHYDYGGYTMDFTSPMMIQTQKISSLAFNYYDGRRIKDGVDLKNERHTQHAVHKLPNLLEFFTYTLYFHGALAGPFVFFTDYIRYIHGYGCNILPDSKFRFSKTVGHIILHGIMTAYVAPQFGIQFVLSPDYQVMPMSRRIFHSYFSLALARQKYYFAWSLAEAAAVSAGLGYTGCDPVTGETQWETVENYDFFKIEAGSSLKLLIDGWNIKTTHWLREVIYDRTPLWCRTWIVFCCSSFWHGFYPGYYLMFLSLAFFTEAARIVRRNVRPYFQKNLISAKGYDIFTTVVCRLTVTYIQGPFMLLELQRSLMFWKPFYFFPHTVAAFILLVSYLKPKFRLPTSFPYIQTTADISKAKVN